MACSHRVAGCLGLFVTFVMACHATTNAAETTLVQLDQDSTEILVIPPLSKGAPTPGRRVRATPTEYADTDLFHTVYLPPNWKKEGPALPIIFEYTGNYFPKAGSTGEPKDGALGFALSAGKYIWVSLPYVNSDHTANAVTWWGDEKATIDYAKTNVPRIIRKYGADPNAVFLCGFSRGAIGVNYIGLHDDEISKLWTAFISHDHFDGVKEWRGTKWGSPLKPYREGAKARLQRVGGRPYLVSQHGKTYGADAFVRANVAESENFTFLFIDPIEIFGAFPNEYAKAAHTDRWALKPSKYRTATWAWMNRVVAQSRDLHD